MKKGLLFCLAFMSFLLVQATHNRAGEITYKHISGLTYEVTVTIFADPNSPAIGRREIEVDWGDNTGKDSLNVVQEINVIPGFVRKRIWRANHTFPGPGDYKISVTDPNRNGGVDNIDNSSAVPFYVQSTLRIFPINGIFNSSPNLLNDPIDDACLGQTFVHNPGAVDPDGDSLAYEISPSLGLNGTVAPGYVYPPASAQIFVDPLTGDLRWENPSQIGIFNVAIRIVEYRNGVFIGDVLRDLQIVVYSGCNNNPPIISVNRNTCLEAGTTLNLPIQAIDQNAQDQVTLSITGEIFEPNVPNQAVVNYGPVSNPSNASIFWNTQCANIRPATYSVSIKATDNGFVRGSTNLSSFETATIRVVGPAVKNVSVQPQIKDLLLTWDPSACSNAVGYKIYRRIDSSGFVPGDCEVGVPESTGYTEIFQSNDPNLSSFVDDDGGKGIIPGQKYCYLITARYPDGDEGYASIEVCAEIPKVVPVMTGVSIESTSSTNGQVELSWSPPDTIDASVFPAPYRYLIYEIDNNDTELLIDSTNSLDDTTYTILATNTSSRAKRYKVELYSLGQGRAFMAKTAQASSVFLRIQAADNQLNLSWTAAVPWSNDSFLVYRKGPNESGFQLIGQSRDLFYTDQNLANDSNYCYYVESYGDYPGISTKSPIINKSQETCGIPEDNEPACAPILNVESDCNLNQLLLTWNNPNLSCPNADAISYRIYRSQTRNNPNFKLLTSINDIQTLSYSTNLESIAGCYVITSLDSSGNESSFSNLTCVDYCPIYELPNIFTPNGDGVNDLFVPLESPKFRYVESIDLKIYNRWDQLVFETKKPEINWDGKHKDEKKLVPDGIYIFTCIVNELSLEGIKPRLIKGTLTIVDGQPNNFK